jgi:hypothetical protein
MGASCLLQLARVRTYVYIRRLLRPVHRTAKLVLYPHCLLARFMHAPCIHLYPVWSYLVTVSLTMIICWWHNILPNTRIIYYTQRKHGARTHISTARVWPTCPCAYKLDWSWPRHMIITIRRAWTCTKIEERLRSRVHEMCPHFYTLCMNIYICVMNSL